MIEPTALATYDSTELDDPEIEPIGRRRSDPDRRIDDVRRSLPPELRDRLLPEPDNRSDVPVVPVPGEVTRPDAGTDATATPPGTEDAPPPARRSGVGRRLTVAALLTVAFGASVTWLGAGGFLGGATATDAASAGRLFTEGGGLHTLSPSQLALPYVVLAAVAHLLSFAGVAAPWVTAAAAVTVTAVALGAVAAYRTVLHAGDSHVGGAVAAATYVVGFLGVAGLASPPGVTPAAALTAMFVVATVAGLSRWATSTKPYSGGELAVFCGLPAAAAMASGFAGWILAALAAVAVAVVAQRRWGIVGYSRHLVENYLAVPAVTVLLVAWFSYRSFGDPLAFMAGVTTTDPATSPAVAPLPSALVVFTLWFVTAAAAGALAWALSARASAQAIAPWLLPVVPALYAAASVWTGRAVLVDDVLATAAGAVPLAWLAVPAVATMLGLGVATLHRHEATDTTVGRAVCTAHTSGTTA